ncbi:hypothetical protein [Planctobacterium marinum]|uniref:Diguanylate cyclase n=1 Tax=Planctobacterium marinum TaxID=1631968 RepID=A0AA48HH01_9ALTE|nr:diguanylate cyclase [Planctobacterium marinum]
MQFDHINISAPAALLKQERDFLCEVFAVKEGFRPDFSRSGYWLYHGENAFFHLMESELHNKPEQPAHLDHVALRMQGLGDFLQKLKSLEIDYKIMTQKALSITQVFFYTPSAIRLEVVFHESL